TAMGRSGLAVWVPVPDEPAITTALLQRGWAVAPGERFRITAPPGIRIGTGTLTSDEASRLAADIADCLAPRALRPARVRGQPTGGRAPRTGNRRTGGPTNRFVRGGNPGQQRGPGPPGVAGPARVGENRGQAAMRAAEVAGSSASSSTSRTSVT